MQRYVFKLPGSLIELRAATRDADLGIRSTQPSGQGETDDPDGGAVLRIDVVQSVGWVNESIQGVRFGTDGWNLDRIAVEQPVVSGVFQREAWGFHGEFRVGGDGVAPLDGLMSLGLSLLCEDRGDLLLHASAVEWGEAALLFLGRGGTGKTTIATELNRDRAPFCVDKALVTARPGEPLCVHSTPFGNGLDPSWRPRSASIAGLFFIEQADVHEVVPLSRWEATHRLIGQAVAASRDPAAVQRTMDAVGRLADMDASFLLRFRKDDGFWPLIDSALSKG